MTAPKDARPPAPLEFGDHVRPRSGQVMEGVWGVVTSVFRPYGSGHKYDVIFPDGDVEAYYPDDLKRILPPDVSALIKVARNCASVLIEGDVDSSRKLDTYFSVLTAIDKLERKGGDEDGN